jgi:deoxyribodipyrimidine photo-lyase
MQQSQRAEWNHALEHAIDAANDAGLPLVVGFGITVRFPGASLRHYRFMLEGLRETQQSLERRGIRLVVRRDPPPRAALELARDAALVVTDRGYLRVQKGWRERVAARAPCRVVQVESDVVVPVEVVSDKQEFAARTIRPKIHRHLEAYLVPLRKRRLKRDSLEMRFESFDLADVDAALERLRINRDVPPAPGFTGGTSRARARLRTFIGGPLADYADLRNNPALDVQSNLSPYLHFGQVSPLYAALEVLRSGAPSAAVDAFLEELIVRRELSMNFVHYQPRYDDPTCLPDWARKTLDKHRSDPREPVYAPAKLDWAETHDPYWNAAQLEMVRGGKMHNYMRMYWGKKILEWSRTPERAFRTALRLNNKYELDGRDPNGFTGVAWCFGLHDRPWGERPIFGTVRTMTAGGLDRKFDMDAYVRKVEERT